jgi:hypothetical protein
VNDERKAELAVEGCVALLAEGLESWEALSKEPTEKTRLPWAVLRLEGRQGGALGSGIHLAKDVRKRCGASNAGAPKRGSPLAWLFTRSLVLSEGYGAPATGAAWLDLDDGHRLLKKRSADSLRKLSSQASRTCLRDSPFPTPHDGVGQ